MQIRTSSESQELLMSAESMIEFTGSVSIQKSDNKIADDALSTAKRAMSFVLKASGLTLTWTNVIFEGHTGPEHDGSNSAGLTQ